MGLTYCCCNAAGSICNSCLGSTAVGTTGRKRSVLLLTMAIALALWFQYSVGPAIVTQSETSWVWKTYRWIPGLGKMVYKSWHEPCEAYEDDLNLLHQCAGNAGAYRPTSVATLFFVLSAVATKIQPGLNREVWPAKYSMYLLVVSFTMLLSSFPLFTGLYLWIARFGATAFVLLQQIILIDVAYNWNDDMLERADRADRLDYGSGASWLHLVVGTCAAFYVLSIVGIALLYHFFDSCPENTWVITLTLLGIIALTAIQLTGTDGSLLTSSIISLYATYLAYSMVSKNPNGQCNPQLGDNDVWGIVIGMTLTAVSLAWTGWSWTAEGRLNVDGVQSARSVNATADASNGQVNLDVPFLDPDERPTAGLVMDSGARGENSESLLGSNNSSGIGIDIWKLNVVMALISCWVAMTLTGWGTLISVDEEGTSNAANPTVGRVNMAMIGVSQWSAILLYVWTLLAPRIFPDRDFS